MGGRASEGGDMRGEEGSDPGTTVASRIALFETGSAVVVEQREGCDNDRQEVVNNNNIYSGKQGGTPVGRYLDLDDIIEESSIETDDGGGEDSDGYLAASAEETTSSPDTSFRLSGRSSSSSDRSTDGKNNPLS